MKFATNTRSRTNYDKAEWVNNKPYFVEDHIVILIVNAN